MKFVPQVLESIPAGVYTVKVVGYECRKSKGTHRPYIRWKLSIVSPEVFESRPVFHNTMLDGSISFLKVFLRAIDGVYEGSEFEAEEYLNKQLVVEIEYPISENGTSAEYPNVVRVFSCSETNEFFNVTNDHSSLSEISQEL